MLKSMLSPLKEIFFTKESVSNFSNKFLKNLALMHLRQFFLISMSCVIDPALHLFVTTCWQLSWISLGPCEAPSLHLFPMVLISRSHCLQSTGLFWKSNKRISWKRNFWWNYLHFAMGDVERPVAEQLTLSRDVKRACELLEKLQKSKYCELKSVNQKQQWRD